MSVMVRGEGSAGLRTTVVNVYVINADWIKKRASVPRRWGLQLLRSNYQHTSSGYGFTVDVIVKVFLTPPVLLVNSSSGARCRLETDILLLLLVVGKSEAQVGY